MAKVRKKNRRVKAHDHKQPSEQPILLNKKRYFIFIPNTPIFFVYFPGNRRNQKKTIA